STLAARTSTWTRRHLLDVDDLSRSEMETVLDEAADLRDRRASGQLGEAQEMLAGQTVALAFYEASTRTRVSFELAARELGATVVDLSVTGSSVAKGESLVDTMLTLERTGVRTVVLRQAGAGAPYLVARSTRLRVLNAGDGAHAHPTQALLDALTLRVQLERAAGGGIASLREYTRSWGLDEERMSWARAGAPLLHPGPTNEGIELTAELAASERSLIGRQVTNGVAVRMAVLSLLAS